MATDRLTIDELARRAGLTTRNVRAYQERGLLPPPVRAGRVGYYDERHLARLSIVGELLERGYSLASIRELIDAWEAGGDLGQLLGFEKALARPWSDEHPVLVTAAELEARFGADPAALRRAVELHLVVPEEDGFLVPSMQALEAGAELLAAGIPLDAVLDEAAALQEDADRIAERFVHLLFHHVWEPFVEAGMPPDQLPRITEVIERLRPVAAMAVLPALANAMSRKVSAAVGSEVAHVAKDDRAAS